MQTLPKSQAQTIRSTKFKDIEAYTIGLVLLDDVSYGILMPSFAENSGSRTSSSASRRSRGLYFHSLGNILKIWMVQLQWERTRAPNTLMTCVDMTPGGTPEWLRLHE